MQCLSKLVQILISLRPTVNIESGPTLYLLDLVTEAGMFDLKNVTIKNNRVVLSGGPFIFLFHFLA